MSKSRNKVQVSSCRRKLFKILQYQEKSDVNSEVRCEEQLLIAIRLMDDP